MSKSYLLLIVTFVLFWSCTQTQNNTSHLTIIDNSKDIGNIQIIRPIDGMIIWENNSDSIQANQEGNYNYKLNIQSPEIIKLIINNERLNMVIQPNQSYELLVTDSNLKFMGSNAEGNNLLNEFNRPANGTIKEAQLFVNDSTATLLKQKIDSFKTSDLKKLDQLLTQNDIDATFYDMVANEIN
ncbi:MAG: hypothetical protein BM564_02970 [Bacteroidetes bacterium MedPE-SWsnd-G2]|nr:MAG: hypothetical protein BM564_02970 [Bacteroidetes bacterium MedPE-SWsnd-G2]